MRFILSNLLMMTVLVAALSAVDADAQSTERPTIKILGKEVLTNRERRKKSFEDNIPETWGDAESRAALNNRKDIALYDHMPILGDMLAPVTIVELTDLSCLQCMSVVKKMDKLREKYQENIRFVHVHLPVDLFNATNPAAFYGRLAHKSNVFWDYRESLMHLDETSDSIYTDKLVSLGIDRAELRTLIREKARTAYRELDADAILGKKMGETRPPIYFINGVRVDEEMEDEMIEDLIQFQIKTAY